jgi:hypothetical protein
MGEGAADSEELSLRAKQAPLFPKLKNPFNQMYVQRMKMGMASYWFSAQLDQSYILYQPEVCTRWFLDDGSRPQLESILKRFRMRTKRAHSVVWYDGSPFDSPVIRNGSTP